MLRKNKSRLIFLIILSVICVIGALIVFKAPNNAKENNSSNTETIITEYPDFSVKSSFGSIIHNKTVARYHYGKGLPHFLLRIIIRKDTRFLDFLNRFCFFGVKMSVADTHIEFIGNILSYFRKMRYIFGKYI